MQISSFFADSLQPVVAVSTQDYYNIIIITALVRKILDVKRFLKKQYESTNKYFGMALFTWLNIVEEVLQYELDKYLKDNKMFHYISSNASNALRVS